MGLDMYLNKNYYITEQENDSEMRQSLGNEFVKTKKVKQIICEGIYWRKSNYIHKWFVDNVQEGKDDCKKYEVTVEQLKELYRLVSKTIKDKNPELLPSQSGFFFGSTEYDDYYWKDLKRTKKELKALLDECKMHKDDWTFWLTYQASW
jgi:hypothetical protein